LTAALSDDTADTPWEVFRRCEAADALGDIGPPAAAAIPALVRTLTVPVAVDCVLALRVAAARALWRIGGRSDLPLPRLIAALEDEQWGVVRTAVESLSEMGEAGRPAAVWLVALARKRLANGPFHFEKWAEDSGSGPPAPFLAVIAEALGKCASGLPEAGDVLSTLSNSPDGRIRASAEAALARRANTRAEVAEIGRAHV